MQQFSQLHNTIYNKTIYITIKILVEIVWEPQKLRLTDWWKKLQSPGAEKNIHKILIYDTVDSSEQLNKR